MKLMLNFSGQEWRVQEFTSSGTFYKPSGVNKCEAVILLVGGGQGGGNTSNNGAGGASGQGKIGFYYLTDASYTVTIGSGGAYYSGAAGYAGGNSYFGSLMCALGGQQGFNPYYDLGYRVCMPMFGNLLYCTKANGGRYATVSPLVPQSILSIEMFGTNQGVHFYLPGGLTNANYTFGAAGYRGDSGYSVNSAANTGAGGGNNRAGGSGYCSIAYRVV